MTVQKKRSHALQLVPAEELRHFLMKFTKNLLKINIFFMYFYM